MRVVEQRPTEPYILSGQSLAALPLKSETTQGCPLSPLLLNTVVKLGKSRGMNTRKKGAVMG